MCLFICCCCWGSMRPGKRSTTMLRLKPGAEGLVKKKQPYTCIPGYVKIRYVFLILLVLYVSIMS